VQAALERGSGWERREDRGKVFWGGGVYQRMEFSLSDCMSLGTGLKKRKGEEKRSEVKGEEAMKKASHLPLIEWSEKGTSGSKLGSGERCKDTEQSKKG